MAEPRVMSPQVLRIADLPDGGRCWYCKVPADLTPLQGHFRNLPIVAGVCQIRWVMDFWRQWTGRPAAVARMTRVKFHQFLRPGDPFCVVLAEKNGTVRFRMFHDQVQYSSGTLVLRT